MTRADRIAALKDALAERVVVLDGAMGTMIQRHSLEEADFRGARFADHGHDLKGANDLLVLTQPQIIKDIHLAYLEAGADIAETNTFNATTIAMADYGLEAHVREINREAARLAREAADEVSAETGHIRWVAGALGPTNRTASISPDVSDPGFRNVTFTELVVAYRRPQRACLRAGRISCSSRPSSTRSTPRLPSTQCVSSSTHSTPRIGLG